MPPCVLPRDGVRVVIVGAAPCTVKDAVTLRAWLIVTTQVPVPLHPSPLQPLKLELAPAVAVSVTGVLYA